MFQDILSNFVLAISKTDFKILFYTFRHHKNSYNSFNVGVRHMV